MKKNQNTAKSIIVLILGIIAFGATFMIQGKMTREGNQSVVGIIAQVQVIISTLLVVMAQKKGYIAGLILNFISSGCAAMQVIRSGKTESVPGVIIPVCTIITITIIFVFSVRIRKMHDVLSENYEALMETNRVIQEKDKKLSYLAYFDVLTNMPNRQSFIDTLDEKIKNDAAGTVIYMDIDDFKRINDYYGHNTGDIMLCEYAERLNRFCGNVNYAGRIGGDEFGIILPGNFSEAAIYEYVEKLRALFAEPVTVNGNMFRITMSYGIASYPRDGRTSQDIFKCTDIAVFNAKATGKDRPYFYSQQQQYMRRPM